MGPSVYLICATIDAGNWNYKPYKPIASQGIIPFFFILRISRIQITIISRENH